MIFAQFMRIDSVEIPQLQSQLELITVLLLLLIIDIFFFWIDFILFSFATLFIENPHFRLNIWSVSYLF